MFPHSNYSLCPPAGLGKWWSTSWTQHHGTEHFHPEGPKAHRLCASDQSPVQPALYFLQKGSVIALHNCICWIPCQCWCFCQLQAAFSHTHTHTHTQTHRHTDRQTDRQTEIPCFYREMEFEKNVKDRKGWFIKTVLVFASTRLVFSSARGRAQSAVMPALLLIQTPTMRMISAVQRRTAVKVIYHSEYE